MHLKLWKPWKSFNAQYYFRLWIKNSILRM